VNDLDIQRGNELHKCTEIIRQSGQDMMVAFYRAGVAFKNVRDKELWREAYESFAAYYTDLGFEKSRVSRAIKTVENLKLKEVAGLQLAKLYAILPSIDKKNKSELLNKAKSLSTGDLYHELRFRKAKEDDPKLPEPPKVYRCNECGGLKGIRFLDLCKCKMSMAQAKYIQTIIDKVEAGEYEV